jgi:hypothetical protein
MMYVGIRADEDRAAYISTKPNIKTMLPFKEAGYTIDDIHRVLDESGVGLPGYYDWRTRSGCYFCFFQRRAEWVGLMERHPGLFDLAKEYEKFNAETGERFTWSGKESLEELSRPERVAEIKERHDRAMAAKKKKRINLPLVEALDEVLADEESSRI